MASYNNNAVGVTEHRQGCKPLIKNYIYKSTL